MSTPTSAWIGSLVAALMLLFFAPATASAQAPDKEYTLAIGETLTFNAKGLSDVTVGRGSIVDAKLTPNGKQLLVTANSPGVTTINIYSAQGQKTILVRVVPVNPEALASEVRQIMGERSGVDVRVVKGRVLLEGEVASENYKKKIETLSGLYPNQLLNFTSFRDAFVEGARMVAVDVYFIQLAVTDRDNIGVNLGQFLGANYTFGTGDVPLYYTDETEGVGEGIMPGEHNPARLPSALVRTAGDGLTSYSSVVGNLNVALDFMAQHGLIKTIQHGVVVTETGTEAKYHTGGSILIPIQTAQTSSVLEKEYGLTVNVRPVLDFENQVKLTVDAEYSELDFANGVNDIPAIKNTDLEATVNMLEGQSVLLSSQMNTIDTSNQEGVWMLMRVPILGWLFKKRSYLGTQLNNALFITPRLYEPGGKTHRTLIQGAFETLLESGAEANDLPELSNAQSQAGTAAKTTSSSTTTSSDTSSSGGGEEELLDE